MASAALVAFVPGVSADHGQPCDGLVDTGCEMGGYTWCSPNDPDNPVWGPGYRSTNDSCFPGYQPQYVHGQDCGTYVAGNCF